MNKQSPNGKTIVCEKMPASAIETGIGPGRAAVQVVSV